MQVLSGLQVCPQVPQLDSSVLRFVQEPPQQVAVRPEHMCPQEPQLPLLVVRFTQVPPQFVCPKITQFFVTTPPSVPRLCTPEEVVPVVTGVVVSDVTGAVVISAGIVIQADALHVMPAGHIFPQMPQFVALDASS